MPELPEVETIKNQLEEKLPLKVVSVSYSKVSSSILKSKNKNFSPKGMLLERISRHGKMLIFHLDDQKFILNHLGMSGSWRISPVKVDEKHTHIQLKCIHLKTQDSEDSNEVYLAYIDPRRFGNMYFYNQIQKEEYIGKLGIDISSKQFTRKYLQEVFFKFPNKVLKPFLLDQKYFAGCGNYIASEICARAGILPTRLCSEIKENELPKIITATKEIISSQIKHNGLTFSGGYQDAYGEKGEGVKDLVVFHQQICGLCHKTKTIKITLNTRGTYYCPRCQK